MIMHISTSHASRQIRRDMGLSATVLSGVVRHQLPQPDVGERGHTATAVGDFDGRRIMSTDRQRDMMAAAVGLQDWQAEYAEHLDMLPARAVAGGWSTTQLAQIRSLVPAIVERIGTERPLGAHRCATRLGTRLMIGVADDDVRVLYELGHLEIVGTYSPPDEHLDHALFALHKLDALSRSVVDPVIQARLLGTTATLSETQACAELGWPGGTLIVAVLLNRIRPNAVGRFTRDAVAALAIDAEFQQMLDQIRPTQNDQ
ncbi:hypothetical protein ACFXG4_19685 [Nocardia sp. NPDC059246]|uniref:hypothetical protein n=1 Tax=unclassified Nocardia TaxID=2637762 RepID=UPI00368B0CE3